MGIINFKSQRKTSCLAVGGAIAVLILALLLAPGPSGLSNGKAQAQRLERFAAGKPAMSPFPREWGRSSGGAGSGVTIVPDSIKVLMPDGGVRTMDMDEYLKGVVAAEVPSSWPYHSLAAQAVAARSYAATADRHPEAGADVCTSPDHCQAWQIDNYPSTDYAVESTSKVAALYQGEIIYSFYFSHCNGHTRSSEEVWGFPLPYCVSVSCPCGFTEHGAHGVGMCQEGSRVLAASGREYPDILKHYYTGTEVKNTGLFPFITGVSPTSGPEGTTVTIAGSNFGSARGSSYVSFGSVKATDYTPWSNTQIKCKVPSGVSGAVSVKVTTSAGTSNSKTFTVTQPTWYLAEGTTDWDFETYISIENPNDTAVTANVTYMPTGQDNVQESLALPAQSQTTLTNGHLVSVMGGMRDFSTEVECAEGKTIAVDRTMSWTGPGAASPDGHCSVGVTSPNETWYLPEGSTNWGFETFLLVQNPGDTDATCTVTYMIENEDPQSFTKAVPANSRATYNMANDIGSKDASIKVESDVPVICERAMYRNSRREGHDSIGTTTPAQDYYLAEGTTAWGYTTFVLIQNPGDNEASVEVTYMVSGEGAVPHPGNPVVMAPNSRRTLRINNVLPGKDFSTHVHADKPIIAERAMYWDNGMGEACHDSIGMSSPHRTFYLPDGQSSEGRETFTLIANPNDTAVTVDVTYMTPTGEGNVTKTVTVNANSRITFNMLEHSGIEGRAAIMVTSTTSGMKIMAERAMYWNGRNAGTDTIGGFSD